jgi:hypothetical protein
MKLIIDPEAVALIKEEGGHVVVAPAKGGGCGTIGSLIQPQAEFGKPDRPVAAFRVIAVDGATIYLDRVLDSQVASTWRLRVTRFLNWQNLEVAYEGN